MTCYITDELDYSLRASHPQASASPHRPQAALHITHPNTHWGRTSTGGKHVTGQSNSHTDTWNNDHKGYLTRSSSDKLLTTTTTTATPLLPWLQQPPEEPFIGGHTTQDYNISSDVSSQSRSSKVNFVKSVPPPSTHFFFHRVFLDKSFDNRTRQPYHRPVLALTARDIGAAKSSVDKKGNTSDAANHTAHESNHGSATKEFTDKFDSLPATPKHSDESSQGKEVTQDEDERHGESASVSAAMGGEAVEAGSPAAPPSHIRRPVATGSPSRASPQRQWSVKKRDVHLKAGQHKGRQLISKSWLRKGYIVKHIQQNIMSTSGHSGRVALMTLNSCLCSSVAQSDMPHASHRKL
ncbi:hypothetical protein E2C01_033610 [Portunus trituberculatus]|uniref:Uncharacterized protein n=1 Tax=Portunus trituberculatus TaxID=210409 RepID=A0A5B7F3X2_PORTR|nr:hypothetical protein [Portunus trituberculatus]